jgi:hypothetical protein
LPYFSDDRSGTQRRPVWSRLTHRGDGDGEQAGGGVEALCLDPTVVSGPIEPLMVCGRQAAHRGQGWASGQDPLREVGMKAHPFPVGDAEGTAAIPYSIGDADAPDIRYQRRAA